MLDFVLSLFSSVLGMNMRDHHDIPFALPLVMAAVLGLIIGFTFLSLIKNEQAEEANNQQSASNDAE